MYKEREDTLVVYAFGIFMSENLLYKTLHIRQHTKKKRVKIKSSEKCSINTQVSLIRFSFYCHFVECVSHNHINSTQNPMANIAVRNINIDNSVFNAHIHIYSAC